MIKKIILLIIIYMISASFIGFDDGNGLEFIPYKYLPNKVQDFVNKYFEEYEVHSAALSSYYIVIFKGG